jgi:acetylornithine deacetylase
MPINSKQMTIDHLIDQQVDKLEEEIVSFVGDLIKFPSVQGQEKEAQLFIAEELKKMRMSTRFFQPDPNKLKKFENLMLAREDYSNSPNLVGILKGTGSGRSLILNSHIDVVPSGDTDWIGDPWSGKHVDGKIFGRGASDMKSGAAANIYAVRVLQEIGLKLKGDLIIQSVVDEESGGAGTAAMLSEGYYADAAIITEPTDLKIYPACMGSMWFRVRIKGKAAHGATSYQGVNAAEKAFVVLNALKKLETKRAISKEHELYRHLEIPFTINVGRFVAGDWPSSVPGEAILEGRMGVSPDESISQAREEFENSIMEAALTDKWLSINVPETEWFGSCWVGGSIKKDHQLTNLIATNYRNTTQHETMIQGAPWATDAGILIQHGQIPTVIFGPGIGKVAHQANEYVCVEDIKICIKVLAKSIVQWCEATEESGN